MKLFFRKFIAGFLFICLMLSMLSACQIADCFSLNGDSAEAAKAEQTAQERKQKQEEARRVQLSKDAENGLFLLVNKEHPLTEDYCPEDLAPMRYYVPDRMPDWRFMRQEAADSYHRMVEAAWAEDVDFAMTTAYRNYDFQAVLWANALKRHGSPEEAGRLVAKPGQSEHQTGLAVDVSSAENDYNLTENFGDTEAGRWIARHAAEYGFILRYPKDGAEKTGYDYEPWHLRYVGKTAAGEITAQGLVLEEYLDRLREEGILS